jgi:FtsZ-interacting cell division protein YlmF
VSVILEVTPFVNLGVKYSSMFKFKKLWMGPDNNVFNEGFDNLFNVDEDYRIPPPSQDVKSQLNTMTQVKTVDTIKEGFESAMDTVFGRKSHKEDGFRVPNTAPAPLQLVQNGVSSVNIVVVEPRTFEDSLEIVNNLKERKSVIVNLQYLDQALSQRVIDFVSGATLALDGTQERVGHGVFIFASMNCIVQTETDSTRAYKDLFSKTFS